MANVSSIKPAESYVQSSQLPEEASHIAKSNGHKFSSSSDSFSNITDITKAAFQEAASLDLNSDKLTDNLHAKQTDEVSNDQKILAFGNILSKSDAVGEVKKAFQLAFKENNIAPANADANNKLDQVIEQEVTNGYQKFQAAASHGEIKDNLHAIAAAALRKADLPNNFVKENSDGTQSPISAEELDSLIDDIADYASDHICAKYIPTYQPKYDHHIEEEHEDKQVDNKEHTEQLDKTHTVAHLRSTQRTPSTDNQYKVAIEIAVLGKLIIIENSILERMREERSEEKREEQLQDLISRIKHDVIKREILSNEVKATEIKLQDLKGRLNKFIDMPIEEMVKISQAYSTAAPGTVVNRKIRLRLPGIHKMKSVAAGAA